MSQVQNPNVQFLRREKKSFPVLVRHGVLMLVAMGAPFSLLADANIRSRVLLQLEPAASTTDKRVAAMDRARALGARLNMAQEVGSGPAHDMMVGSAEGMRAEALAERL